MEQRPLIRRSRPPQEPGPRLLPIALGIALVGFVLGIGGKLLSASFHHQPVSRVAPHPTSSPNYALVALQTHQAKLAPIPTPHGTWFITVTPRPSPRIAAHSAKPQATGVPSPIPAPSPTPHPSSKPSPTRTPSPSPTPSPTPTLKPQPSPSPAPVATKPPRIAVPTISRPTPRRSVPKVAHIVPTVTAIPVETLRPIATPQPFVTPQASAPERLVRRYLSSLIHGDEATAYSLLGAVPGDKNTHLSEESFINTSAHITSISTGKNTPPNIVHAEIETAGGSYYATYYTEARDSRLIIRDHSFIKL